MKGHIEAKYQIKTVSEQRSPNKVSHFLSTFAIVSFFCQSKHFRVQRPLLYLHKSALPTKAQTTTGGPSDGRRSFWSITTPVELVPASWVPGSAQGVSFFAALLFWKTPLQSTLQFWHFWVYLVNLVSLPPDHFVHCSSFYMKLVPLQAAFGFPHWPSLVPLYFCFGQKYFSDLFSLGFSAFIFVTGNAVHWLQAALLYYRKKEIINKQESRIGFLEAFRSKLAAIPCWRAWRMKCGTPKNR